LTQATEFHPKCIYFGKFPFKGWKPEKRLEVLARLVDIIAQPNVVRRVYAKINSPKLKAPHKAAEFAFAHFCERVQMLVGKDKRTLLIGDKIARRITIGGMPVILIVCPISSREFSTGINIDKGSFDVLPEVPARARCPHCAREHEWRKSDARLAESVPPAEWIENENAGPGRPEQHFLRCHPR